MVRQEPKVVVVVVVAFAGKSNGIWQQQVPDMVRCTQIAVFESVGRTCTMRYTLCTYLTCAILNGCLSAPLAGKLARRLCVTIERMHVLLMCR